MRRSTLAVVLAASVAASGCRTAGGVSGTLIGTAATVAILPGAIAACDPIEPQGHCESAAAAVAIVLAAIAVAGFWYAVHSERHADDPAPPPPPPAFNELPPAPPQPVDNSPAGKVARLMIDARVAASLGHCPVVVMFGKRIAAIDANAYATTFRTDPALQVCL